MKKLEEIKNKVAQDNGWERYSQLTQVFRSGVISENSFDDYIDELCQDYATEAIKADRERVAQKAFCTNTCTVWNCEGESVDKESILNLPIELP